MSLQQTFDVTSIFSDAHTLRRIRGAIFKSGAIQHEEFDDVINELFIALAMPETLSYVYQPEKGFRVSETLDECALAWICALPLRAVIQRYRRKGLVNKHFDSSVELHDVDNDAEFKLREARFKSDLHAKSQGHARKVLEATDFQGGWQGLNAKEKELLAERLSMSGSQFERAVTTLNMYVRELCEKHFNLAA